MSGPVNLNRRLAAIERGFCRRPVPKTVEEMTDAELNAEIERLVRSLGRPVPTTPEEIQAETHWLRQELMKDMTDAELLGLLGFSPGYVPSDEELRQHIAEADGEAMP